MSANSVFLIMNIVIVITHAAIACKGLPASILDFLLKRFGYSFKRTSRQGSKPLSQLAQEVVDQAKADNFELVFRVRINADDNVDEECVLKRFRKWDNESSRDAQSASGGGPPEGGPPDDGPTGDGPPGGGSLDTPPPDGAFPSGGSSDQGPSDDGSLDDDLPDELPRWDYSLPRRPHGMHRFQRGISRWPGTPFHNYLPRDYYSDVYSRRGRRWDYFY